MFWQYVHTLLFSCLPTRIFYWFISNKIIYFCTFMSNTTTATCGTGSACNPNGAHDIKPVFDWVRVAQLFMLCFMYCRLSFCLFPLFSKALPVCFRLKSLNTRLVYFASLFPQVMYHLWSFIENKRPNSTEGIILVISKQTYEDNFRLINLGDMIQF